MLKLLQSNRVKLPIVYLVESEEDMAKIPFGIPIIRESNKNYNEIVQLLEWEVLFQSARESGLPFNWKLLLKDNKFLLPKKDYLITNNGEDLSAEEFISSLHYYVDIEYLKNLKLIPSWFVDIEEAIKINILNTIVYNPSLYNKKLDLCTGDIELSSPLRNCIIIDISSSIPKCISKSILLLAKTMATNFYADLLITGSKSTLYEYNEIDKLNINTIYNENETDNDQIHFIKIISEYRKYDTVISFGDSDHPGHAWHNRFNYGSKKISVSEGKAINKWQINNIIDFYVKDSNDLTGYVRWFDCKNISQIKNWVHYIQD